MDEQYLHRLAERVHSTCVEAVESAYEQAAISGLCGSGAWEVALGALRSLDIERLVRELDDNPGR